ncbi:MAG TPA: GNAT family N-acetyltransferase, partial [Blastocatellia bacterium]|nr:GNAT family N-acetyltransferase [Blastocatellia bacterium]
HGLENPRNRGDFYACFDEGRIVAISLIGHTVVFDSNAEGDQGRVATAFVAAAVRENTAPIRQVLGQRQQVKEFHRSLSNAVASLPAATTARQVLLSLKSRPSADDKKHEVSVAGMGELDQVVEAHAKAYLELCGVDPLTRDAEGFCDRVRARVERGRVWAGRDADGISFKADIISRTDEAVYLEGIWVRPDLRGQGIGTASLKTLCRYLLNDSQTVCLFTDADDPERVAYFRRVGFSPVTSYDFLRYDY